MRGRWERQIIELGSHSEALGQNGTWHDLLILDTDIFDRPQYVRPSREDAVILIVLLTVDAVICILLLILVQMFDL